MKIPKIEYEVYYPLNGSNLIKLDLEICKNIKIDISIPVYINEKEINKYNSSSDYYNDICTKTTSDSGTDISLSDRKNDFIDKNMTLCEEDCILAQYNSTSNVAKCSCSIKTSLPNVQEIKFDKGKIFKNFIDISNIANFILLKCFKQVFSIFGLRKNYGFYIHIFIYILFILCIFLFYFKYYSQLMNNITKLINAKAQLFKLKNNANIETGIYFSKIKKKKKKKRKNSISASSKNPGNSRLEILNNEDSNKNTNFEFKEILECNSNELNSLTYDKALLYDKRTFFEYYISLLKTNHLLIFSFYINNKDYNSQIIKIFLFFFFFAADFTFNALFFNDDTMHKIYIDEGKFNFLYQIPIIVYSSILSEVISSLIRYFALTENLILEIKNEFNFERFNKKVDVVYKKIKVRVSLFFIVAFLLLLFFMYYISCFCGVYVNTQIHLIKDTLVSFVLSLTYSLGLYLIPGIFRIHALKAKNKNKFCLYKFSQIVENLPI